MQENLTCGSWVCKGENMTERMTFDSNGKMTHTVTGNGVDKETVYDYLVSGKKMTLSNLSSGEKTYDICFFGEQLHVMDGNQTKVFLREIELEI